MPNSMVIGGGFYKIVKRTFDNDYYFSKVGAYSIDSQYSISRIFHIKQE